MASKLQQTSWEIGVLSAAVILGYVWLQLPSLHPYSLQPFALAIAAFFVLQIGRRQLRPKLPHWYLWQLAPLTFATTILVGSTGTTTLFALLFALLALLVFNTAWLTSLIITVELFIVLYATAITLDWPYNQQLLFLFVLLGVFQYLRWQQHTSRQQEAALAASTTQLAATEQQRETLEHFIENFLQPKLQALHQLGALPDTGKQILLNQLDLLSSEVAKILAKNKPIQPPHDPPVTV